MPTLSHHNCRCGSTTQPMTCIEVAILSTAAPPIATSCYYPLQVLPTSPARVADSNTHASSGLTMRMCRIRVRVCLIINRDVSTSSGSDGTKSSVEGHLRGGTRNFPWSRFLLCRQTLLLVSLTPLMCCDLATSFQPSLAMKCMKMVLGYHAVPETKTTTIHIMLDGMF